MFNIMKNSEKTGHSGFFKDEFLVLENPDHRMRRFLYKLIRKIKNGSYNFLNYQVVNILDSIFENQRFLRFKDRQKMQKPKLFKNYHTDYKASLSEFLKTSVKKVQKKLLRNAKVYDQHQIARGPFGKIKYESNIEKLADNDFFRSFISGMDAEFDQFLGMEQITLELSGCKNLTTLDQINISAPKFQTDHSSDTDEGDTHINSIPKSTSQYFPTPDLDQLGSPPAPINPQAPPDNYSSENFSSSLFQSNMRNSFNQFNFEQDFRLPSPHLTPPKPNLPMDALILKKLEFLQSEVSKLEFENISLNYQEKSRTIILCVSGFLSEDDDLLKEWACMPQLYQNTEILA